MKQPPQTPPDDTNDEISMLVGRLRETEQRLQELTGGVDSVLYPGGQSLLLRDAQEGLRLSEERFREMFNSAATGMAVSTPRGHFLQVNPAYCRMLGYTQDELLALDFTSLTHPDDLSLNVEMRDELLSGRRDSFILEKRYLKKNGDIQWTRASVSATRMSGGEIATLLLIAEDIAERKLAEVRLRRLNRLHAVLSKVGDAVVRTHDRQELFETVCRIIAKEGLLRMVFIAEVDAEASVARPVASWGAARDTLLWKSTSAIPTDSGPSSLGIVGVAVRSGTFDVCNDIAGAERMGPWHEATSRGGLVAGASFPLRQSGVVVGVLTLFAGERDYFLDDEIGLMVTVADSISFALEALEHEQQRRRAELLSNQLAMIVESSDDAIIGEDLNGFVTSWNKGAERIFGYVAEEMIGASIMRLLPPDRQNQVNRIPERLIHNESVRNFEELAQTKNGRLINVSITASLIKSPAGQITGISTVAHDITQVKKAEARFRRLVDSNAQSVFFWNTTGKITGANDAFLRLVGYTRRDLDAGKIDWTALTPPEYAEDDLRALKETADFGICATYEKEYIRKDGSRVPILVGAAMFEDDPTEGVCFAIDLTERKWIEETLREKLSLLESAQGLAKLGSWTADITPEWRLDGSPEVYRMHAMPEGAFNHRGDAYLALVDARDRQDVASAIGRTIKTGAPYEMEYRIVRPDGAVRWVHSRGRLEVRDAPRRTRMVGVMQDTTDARTAQQHLIQAQKMESIGQLTGGIAHDFNNLLGIIQLNLELIREYTSDYPGTDMMVDMALQATGRGASLTHQLLAYARQQPLEPKIVDIEALLTGMTSLLGRTLGESIALKTVIPRGLWTAVVDAHQLENAILNLAVNSLHAMPDGGTLIIEASNKLLDDVYTGLNPDISPGDYVSISVTDSGVGMAADVLERVLEPFFTTKPVGKGSGLGLSMVHGFAKQSGGHLKIYSEVGLGTAVNLYLPRASTDEKPKAEAQQEKALASIGGEVVLVVEDDRNLRDLTLRVLKSLGYRTIEAEDGPSACEILDRTDRIDLLLTDVVLPRGMTGPEVARHAKSRRPDLGVLYMSGYPRDPIHRDGMLDDNMHLLSKPFPKTELARMVRRVLDERSRA